MQTGQCKHTLLGHSRRIDAIAFAADSVLLATGAMYDSVKIWDAETGECLQTIEILENIDKISFDRTKTWLFTDLGPLALDLPSSYTGKLSRGTSVPTSPRPNKGYAGSKDPWVTKDAQNVLWLPAEYRPGLHSLSRLDYRRGLSLRAGLVCNVLRRGDAVRCRKN